MICRICGNESAFAFKAPIMNGAHDVSYYHCETCRFLETEQPYWLKEAYVSPINASDTGYVTRNVNLSLVSLALCALLFDRSKKFLDYGAGYGIFCRLMRDYGLDFYWSDKHTPNLFCKGFEHAGQPIEAVTCFECFEHFEDPIREIGKILSISKNIIFSTLLVPPGTDVPDKSWWYYGFDHGQHVSLYSLKTLRWIAARYKLNLYSDGINLHILTPKKMHPLIMRLYFRISRSRLAPWFKKSLLR